MQRVYTSGDATHCGDIGAFHRIELVVEYVAYPRRANVTIVEAVHGPLLRLLPLLLRFLGSGEQVGAKDPVTTQVSTEFDRGVPVHVREKIVQLLDGEEEYRLPQSHVNHVINSHVLLLKKGKRHVDNDRRVL